MQNMFPCPNCNSNNLIGQAFCLSCGYKLEYNCPYCRDEVDSSIDFCKKCGASLSWPENPQPEYHNTDTREYQHNVPTGDKYTPEKPAQKHKRQWPVWLTVLIVIILIAAGLVLVIDIFDLKLITLPTSEEPVTTPPPQTPTVQPLITPTILSFTASSTEILLGQSLDLKWDVTDAEIVTISPDIGEVQLSGELSISPETSTTYILTAENGKEIATDAITISVIENIRAADIVLTEQDVNPAGFIFDTHSEPSVDNTISTFHVIYIRTNETFSITVLIFEDISSAEDYYIQTKNNNRGNISDITTLGDLGYSLVFMEEIAGADAYSIRFIKNNVYVNITGLKKYAELESYGKIIESRIH